MNRLVACSASIAVLTLAWAPTVAGERVFETSTVRETFDLDSSATPPRLRVDNVFGSITVTAVGGEAIELVAEKTIRARNGEAAQRARNEVELDVVHRDGFVELYVDGPFREERDRGWRNPGYTVIYEFELRVPHALELELRTVEGEIEVSGVRGDFDVRGVNGGLDLSGLDGSGRATTVNGEVHVGFLHNPEEDCEFSTINGEIEVELQRDLSADLRFKTMNGEVLTDFDFELLPPDPAVRETRDGKKIVLTDAATSVRVGRGGPRLKFENINGDMRVRESR